MMPNCDEISIVVELGCFFVILCATDLYSIYFNKFYFCIKFPVIGIVIIRFEY